MTFGSASTGGFQGFSVWLDKVQLFGPTSNVAFPGGSVTTQVVADVTSLAAGTYQLKVSTTGITGASASHGGNLVATPVPEPETLAMMLAGLGALGFMARRKQLH